jgi:hypothetical protein
VGKTGERLKQDAMHGQVMLTTAILP